jgi:hypothetical protein
VSRSSHNSKARRSVRKKPEIEGVGLATQARHVFGRTEKILRRNRKLWVRLGNKRRRQYAKDTIRSEMPGV